MNRFINAIFNAYDKSKIVSYIFIFFASLLINHYFKFRSFRNAVSDLITVSSIILAILGILLSVLINLREDSYFFHLADKYNHTQMLFKRLMNLLFFNIYLNVFFIVLILLYDILPSISFKIIKLIGNSFVLSIFIFILLDTVYIIHLIYNIYNYKQEDAKTKMES